MDVLRKLAVYAGQGSFKTPSHNKPLETVLNKALASWTTQHGIDIRIEVLSASDFSEAARSLSQAFLVPGRSKFVNVAKERLIELRDLYSLHSTSRKSEAFAILGVWDDDRKKLLASVQVNKQRDPVILKHLPEGTDSYVYGSRLAVDPKTRSKGIGRVMIEAGEFAITVLGESISVLSVYVQNRKAVELYSSYGYKILGQDPRASKKERKHRPAYLCMKHLTR